MYVFDLSFYSKYVQCDYIVCSLWIFYASVSVVTLCLVSPDDDTWGRKEALVCHFASDK